MATRLEVQCINKSDKHTEHERIKSIGGGIGQYAWKHTHEQAMKWIEAGIFSYFVNDGTREAHVFIETSSSGHNYLATVLVGQQLNNLLNLPECP